MSNKIDINQRASSALPSFGLFGGHESNLLSVDIQGPIDRIVIEQRNYQPEPMNILEVKLADRTGKALNKEEIVFDVVASSRYGSQSNADFRKAFLGGGLLHTEREQLPRIEIKLHRHQDIARVTIQNRSSEWGLRSLPLAVIGYCGDKVVTEFFNQSMDRRSEALLRLCAYAEINPLESSDGFEAKLIERLASRFRTSKIGLKSLSFSAVATLDLNITREIKDDEITIIASYALDLIGTRSSLGTHHLGIFGRLLADPASILSLLERINEMGLTRGLDALLVISKHDIHSSVLLSKRDKFLDAANVAINIISQHSRDAVLCYGTLLGAVRSQSFISHDDDFDLLCIDGSRSFEEAVKKGTELIDIFERAGYRCWPKNFVQNFHVTIFDVPIDVFISWEVDDKLLLAMEKMNFRSVDKSYILPPSRISLYNRFYPAPAEPDRFLEERYGKGWSVPDMFYEWPWPLKKNA